MKRLVISLAIAGLVVADCTKEPIIDHGPTDTSEPPRIACPTSVSQVSATGAAIQMVYGTPSVTGGASPVSSSCAPASGGLFPVGSNTVTCTATDTRQRTDSCTLTVVVQKPATIAVTRFMAFGDSITAGEDGRSLTQQTWPGRAFGGLQHPSFIVEKNAYPTVLYGLLAGRYLGQTITMFNEGSRGESAGIASAVSRFSGAVAADRPDVVLIMEGSNDIFDGNPSVIPPAITNLRTMIGIARGRQARPYLATVPPMDPNTNRGDRGHRGYATVGPLNDRIKDLAREQGVPLVDVNAAFNGDVTLLVDGLHPTPDGYAVIANKFFESLRADLETAGPMNASLP